ncbi:Rid family hydrolase [Streptomyces hygroscopicus]|uniref:RidA family protein n=1 Tax=Streptomyces hygroscopicus TaxID=1912 RepID=UPI0009A0443E|nr:Rid family hydrolase [Streptomyces hygroscopicus]
MSRGTMKKHTVIPLNPPTLADPAGHFDRAVRIGDWVFVSGTSALTNLSGPLADRVLPDSFLEQANTTFDNIEKVLEHAGGSLADVYEIRVILNDRNNFGTLDDIFRERFPDRGFIGHGYVAEFLAPGMLIEVEAHAYLPSE